jgi:hypothetical protein
MDQVCQLLAPCRVLSAGGCTTRTPVAGFQSGSVFRWAGAGSGSGIRYARRYDTCTGTWRTSVVCGEDCGVGLQDMMGV